MGITSYDDLLPFAQIVYSRREAKAITNAKVQTYVRVATPNITQEEADFITIKFP